MTKFKFDGLRNALKHHGLNIKGKISLTRKAKKSIEYGAPLVAEMVNSCTKNLAGGAFDPGAYW